MTEPKRFVTTTVEIEGREEITVVEVPAFTPPPWGPDAVLDTVGRGVSRLDAVDKVTGRARYTHDISLPGMLHARIVRASIPAGRVTRLDLSRARALPGVRAVLGMAPLELRRKNHSTEDPLKQRPYSSELLAECWSSVAQRIGWDAARKRKKSTGRFVRGVGMASQVWGAAGGPPAYAVVRLNRDGTALVQTGTQDLGTGARTIFAQIAAEALGLPLADVRIVIGDTDGGPFTNNSWGSMTTPSVGPAVRMAAEDAKRQLFEVAAEMLRAKPDQLEAWRGRISVQGGGSVTIRKVTEQLGDIMIMGRGHRGPNPPGVTVHCFGAQAAEVEVDRVTGRGDRERGVRRGRSPDTGASIDAGARACDARNAQLRY